MKFIRKIYSLFILAGLLFVSANLFAQIPDDIILSINEGNSKVLSGYFNQNVELTVLENDNVYSKAQAQQIVGNFFESHPPREKGFKVIHKSGKEGSQFVIGSLATVNGVFRVSFLLKQNNGKDYIHQLRIEKQKP